MSASAAAERELLSRRALLKRAAGLAALGGGGVGIGLLLGRSSELPSSNSGMTEPVRTFRSRPDLHPPAITVSGQRSSAGFWLLGPSAPAANNGSQTGPLLVDHQGAPAWFSPLPTGTWAANVRLQSFRGDPVLTWWQGKVDKGFGQGEAVIVDRSYRRLAVVRAANGRQMDLHEFLLTPRGTALFTCHPQPVETDISNLGGPRNAQVLEAIVQEVDVSSGRLLFEWRSLQHVAPSESYLPVGNPYDYMHANSIAVSEDGNLLVSGRHTWNVYKLDRRTGEVIWRLGGKHSDFASGNDLRFAWQHHAAPVKDGVISLFDDGSDGLTNTESQSRGLLIAVDETRYRARLLRSYTHPSRLLAPAMGSMQVLPEGNVVIGWGTEPYATEFAADGTLLNDARLPSGLDSYRAFRSPWLGTPSERPAVVADANKSTGVRKLYASWNGATNVHAWRVHAGVSAGSLRPVGIARRRGFETEISLGRQSGYVVATALDRTGRALGASRTIPI